jgi:hypothetical protein
MSYSISNDPPTSNQTLEATIMNTAITQPASFDINAYRITQTYGESLGSRKLITVVNVRKPSKDRFFRTSPDPAHTMNVYVFEDKTESTYYLVNPDVGALLGGLVRAITVHLAVERTNNPFLIPVPLPSENGTRNPWHQSLLNAIETAKQKWVRIESDRSAGIYQVFEALGALEEPKWPELPIEELVRIAFSGRVIDSMDHPKVQSLLGGI